MLLRATLALDQHFEIGKIMDLGQVPEIGLDPLLAEKAQASTCNSKSVQNGLDLG